MNILKNKKTIILILTIILYSSTSLIAQLSRKKIWSEKEIEKHHIEGIYGMNISSDGFEVISLHGAFPTELKQDELLSIQYNSPKEDSFLLVIEEKKIIKNWGWESNPGLIQKGKHIYTKWNPKKAMVHVGEVTSNLGILLLLGNKNENYFLPTFVYAEGEELVLKKYKVAFRLEESLSDHPSANNFKVYQGEYQGDITVEPVTKGRFRQRIGSSIINFPIKINQLKTGWVTVVVNLSLSSGQTVAHRFYFYHQN